MELAVVARTRGGTSAVDGDAEQLARRSAGTRAGSRCRAPSGRRRPGSSRPGRRPGRPAGRGSPTARASGRAWPAARSRGPARPAGEWRMRPARKAGPRPRAVNRDRPVAPPVARSGVNHGLAPGAAAPWRGAAARRASGLVAARSRSLAACPRCHQSRMSLEAFLVWEQDAGAAIRARSTARCSLWRAARRSTRTSASTSPRRCARAGAPARLFRVSRGHEGARGRQMCSTPMWSSAATRNSSTAEPRRAARR